MSFPGIDKLAFQASTMCMKRVLLHYCILQHAKARRRGVIDYCAETKWRPMLKKLSAAAELVEESIHEMLTYYSYPSEYWLELKTNNPMERLLKEARRRTKVVGAFPDGHSALMLVAARASARVRNELGHA